MVEGVKRFSERFGEFGTAFVVIGGTACAAILESAGLPFRTTKDIDVVLFAEAVDAVLVAAFRAFIDWRCDPPRAQMIARSGSALRFECDPSESVAQGNEIAAFRFLAESGTIAGPGGVVCCD